MREKVVEVEAEGRGMDMERRQEGDKGREKETR